MTDQRKPSDSKTDRVIRVFVSSTFRDMKEEREILVKRVFPQFRKICEERQVTWGEVDLRWGITDEQKAERKVLPICLEEIKRCRPYFIGLLGERYGWIPDAIPQDLIDREPWLKEHLSHSVTELEILHGVLRNPEMAEHAFFYFRDPQYLNKLPKDADPSDFISEDESFRTKLKDLKERIIKSGFPVHENYFDPKTLEELVVNDLTEVINKVYPPEEKIDSLDREALDHEAFAQSRAQVYIGRDEYFERLDKHAQINEHPLVVLGESGSGKSALLANWALKYNEDHPDELVIMHFIGASSYSTDWQAMLRRIMGEFKLRFSIQQEIPDKPEELRSAFANWLYMAAAKGRTILIIDALNQLEDRDGALDLVWLPPIIPPNIRIILSTLPGRPLDDLKKRGWPTLTVDLFNHDERKSFITKYLAQYTKSLDEDRAERVAYSKQTSVPLYLQALLEELRVFGIHEQLDERISYYLEAQTIPALYERILARYEGDYERDKPSLVRDALSLIWAARRGLSESELLDILGSDGKPLPQAIWTPLSLAVERSFVNRSGLIGFAHNYFSQAVQNNYLAAKQEQHAAHLRLADYFEKRELNYRKVDELPWQLLCAENWDRLSSILTSLDAFKYALDNGSWYEWMKYWRTIDGIYDPGKYYRKTVDERMCSGEESQEIAEVIGLVGEFLLKMSFYAAALPFLQQALNMSEKVYGPVHPKIASLLVNLGHNCSELGDSYGAEILLKKAVEMSENVYGPTHRETGNFLNALGAFYLLYSGWRKKAEPLLKRAIEIERVFGPTPELDTNLGCLYKEMGRYSEAEPLLKNALEVVEKDYPNSDMVSFILQNLANLYEKMERYGEAELLLIRALKIKEELFGLNNTSTAASLNDLAIVYEDQKKYVEAEAQLKRALQVYERLYPSPSEQVGRCLRNLAYLYLIQHRYNDAKVSIVRALEIYEKLFDDESEVISEVKEESLQITLAKIQSEGNFTNRPLKSNLIQKVRKTLFGKKIFRRIFS